MALMSAVMNVMMRAAQQAGRAILRDFGEVEQLQVSRKGPADFVTQADRKAEKIVREALQKARPDHGLLMEESGQIGDPDARRRFIVDPLDGTTNFLHGLPHWAVSIGYEEDGEIKAGVVYDPVKDEAFWAELGKGAFLNDRRMRVSARSQLADAIFATGIPFKGLYEGDGHAEFLRRLGVVMAHTAGVRRFGSAALDLAYVACGRVDGYWERGLNPWDIAAGILIVREAGGFVTDGQNQAYRFGAREIVAANERLHKPLLEMLAAADK